MIEIVRGLHNLRPRHQGCVLSIGNYDGVHLGHQALIGRVAEQAARHALPATLLSFEPTPLECFRPESAPLRVQNLREKLACLEQYGAERLIIVRFNPQFAAISAESFISDLLVRQLQMRHMVIGDDFRFGKGRAGDFEMLNAASQDFSVEAAPTVALEGERVSSTRLRAALASGDLALAQRLTHRPCLISGRVRSGLGLARELGAPTVNIEVHPARALRHGVYGVTLLAGSERYQAIANFGLRPTVEVARNPAHPLLEVHALSGAPARGLSNASVIFHSFLRDEKKFEDIAALQAQIARDVAEARRWFSENDAD